MSTTDQRLKDRAGPGSYECHAPGCAGPVDCQVHAGVPVDMVTALRSVVHEAWHVLFTDEGESAEDRLRAAFDLLESVGWQPPQSAVPRALEDPPAKKEFPFPRLECPSALGHYWWGGVRGNLAVGSPCPRCGLTLVESPPRTLEDGAALAHADEGQPAPPPVVDLVAALEDSLAAAEERARKTPETGEG